MIRVLTAFLLILTILISFSQGKTDHTAPAYRSLYQEFDRIYHDAEKLSLRPDYNDQTEELESRMNRQALEGFYNIVTTIQKNGDDSLAFQTWYRIGTLEHYFDSLHAAKSAYLKAIAIYPRAPGLSDSFLFKPLLFTGIIYYGLSQFDSALYYFKKAEQTGEKYSKAPAGSNRLYNALGALYYETGNYRQAKNYFSKAISILNPAEPSYRDLLINYKINLAAVLMRLEEYDEANSIYQDLLPYNINRFEILHNIGAIHLRLGSFEKAITYLRQVQYTGSKRVRLFNDMGSAYAGLRKADSANTWLEKGIEENTRWNGDQKNTAHGLTLKYQGDVLMNGGNYAGAIKKYQQSINQFDPGFNDTAMYANPQQYSAVFSYIDLFNALVAKAGAMELLYRQEKNIRMLEASLEAYSSAFRLADYVEKTYDSDEARLFLNKIKYTVHSEPIDISLELFELTKKNKYLEEAYLFDQRNKASVLALDLQENEWKNRMAITNDLFSQESALRSAITRLSLKAAQTTDSIQLQQINNSIRDQEIRLGKLQEKISGDPSYRNNPFVRQIPTIKELQKKLDNTTVLISYHLSEKELLALVISSSAFDYHKEPIDPAFIARIDSFKLALHNTSPDQSYDASGVSAALYRILIAPLRSRLHHTDRLIIIPDDELHYLPFEALQDEQNKYLVEKFSVQYHYSTLLLGTDSKPFPGGNTLSFAPFTSKGYVSPGGTKLSSLPASRQEVAGLEGKTFLDSSATKKNFLQNANRYGIIHLATHASADNQNPMRSSIAFYPGNNSEDYHLYAQEIYDLKLDSTSLVILSACETGTGQLVRGEGLMSLSRAFAFAGCPNIITSLWKAEDNNTAFLTSRLHVYLKKGISRDKALRQAKLDLLHSSQINPRLKTPNFWAHLVLIGDYEPAKGSSRWWWIAAVIVLAMAGIWFVKWKKRRT